MKGRVAGVAPAKRFASVTMETRAGQATSEERGGQDAVDQSIQLLEQRIDDFLGSRDQVISSSRVIDPLLEIWGLAREVDSSVAVPVERLLTALVGRELTTLDELTRTMDEVRAAVAAQTLPTGV
jgi:hypothetical protein